MYICYKYKNCYDKCTESVVVAIFIIDSIKKVERFVNGIQLDELNNM